MDIPKKTWTALILLALLAVSVWYRLEYPSFAFLNLSVNRQEALATARSYLKQKGVPTDKYITVALFKTSNSADRYLQKSLGFIKEKEFLRRQNLTLFYWAVRFFKENEKEEYFVIVDADDGRVKDYTHTVKESAARKFITEDEAREKAIQFLSTTFNFNPEDYEKDTNSSGIFDHRVEYSFIWKKKGVNIPWSSMAGQEGGAKLLTRVKVSGDEILSFGRTYLKIPESFNRYITKENTVGQNLSLLFRILFLTLLTASVFFIILRRNDLVLHTIKRFALTITLLIFVLYLLDYLNTFQTVLFSCRTTDSLPAQIGRGIIGYTLNAAIVVLGILMPYLAGESLRHEVFPDKKRSGLLHYILSSFFQRSVSSQIAAGYLSAAVMLGIQSLALAIGYRYLGVWSQHMWMPEISNSYLPFLAAFSLGIVAGVAEEFTFRLFAVSLGKKFLRSVVAAAVISSFIWGLGHSAYEVYPMWFRGIEVSCLGFFLSYIFLRFGLIATITAHYLFDVFWGTSPYLLGKSDPSLFLSSLAVLLLPLAWAIAAYIRNQPSEERPLRWLLNKHQSFNLDVLKNYLRKDNTLLQKEEKDLKKELVDHGWDLAVVEIALEDIKKGG